MKSVTIPFPGGRAIVSVPNAVTDLTVGRRTYEMEYCTSLGPSFFFKNGKPYYPSCRAPIWNAFKQWLDNYEARK